MQVNFEDRRVSAMFYSGPAQRIVRGTYFWKIDSAKVIPLMECAAAELETWLAHGAAPSRPLSLSRHRSSEPALQIEVAMLGLPVGASNLHVWRCVRVCTYARARARPCACSSWKSHGAYSQAGVVRRQLRRPRSCSYSGPTSASSPGRCMEAMPRRTGRQHGKESLLRASRSSGCRQRIA